MLLRHLKWSVRDNKYLISLEDEDDPVSFNGNNLYEGMDLILNGKPENFDPLNTFDETVYTEEQKQYMDKLFAELPIAIDIVLYLLTTTNNIELGSYKTRYHIRDWKKISE